MVSNPLVLGLEYMSRALELTFPPEPQWATKNTVALDLPTMRLRNFTVNPNDSVPVLIDAPFAGHSSVIADYAEGQSLVQTFLANGATRVYVTDWKSATYDMKDYSVDTYLSDLLLAVDSLGGKVHLVGLCQGGVLSSMFAALYPEKVASLVIAGSPIDTDAGDGPIKKLAHKIPMSDFETMVNVYGGGLMLGQFMLAGWKAMHPEVHYVRKYTGLYHQILDGEEKQIEDSVKFGSWYEHTVDLPGKFYLQVILQLFKLNLLFKGRFVALGQRVDLGNITCPVYLMAGAKDDITTSEQVFNAERVLIGAESINQVLVPGGHIGIFVGKGTLKNFWPDIVQWTQRAA